MLPLKMSRCLSSAVPLPRVDATFNVPYLSYVDICRCIIFRSSPLSSICSSSDPEFHFHFHQLCCGSCGVLAHKDMSTAEIR